MWEYILTKILRLSSVTRYEEALITGHYLSLTNNNDIDPRLLEKGFTEDQIKQMRRSMGSNSVVGGDFKFTIDLKEIKHPDFNFLYTIYDAWTNHNVLPFSGSYSEQPNKIVEQFLILDRLRYENERKLHAEAQRKAKSQHNKRK